jgi:cytochrome b subunit of formate dehydrogenase
MDAKESTQASELRESVSQRPEDSALLREIAEELRQERKRLAAQAERRDIDEAEQEIAADLAAEARRLLRERVGGKEKRSKAAAKRGEVVRFSLIFRLQHFGLLASTLILIVTGLPLRYAETAWAHTFFGWIGGVRVTAPIHHFAAALLILVGTFHMGYITLTREGRRELLALLPRPKDFGDLFRNLAYFVGLRRRGPQFDRFSYVEKFDYWAVYWGIVIMISSGLLLWFPEVVMRHLPKYVMDIAKVVHSDEALLAAISIVIWHFYNAHFNPEWFPMNWTWLTGHISTEHMLKHHPLEYERRFAGNVEKDQST